MVRKGQIYRCKAKLPVICMTSWSAPFTGGHERVLPRGESFKISNDPPASATAVYADPINYDELHAILIPDDDRKAKNYVGFYLCVQLEQIESDCELIGNS